MYYLLKNKEYGNSDYVLFSQQILKKTSVIRGIPDLFLGIPRLVLTWRVRALRLRLGGWGTGTR